MKTIVSVLVWLALMNGTGQVEAVTQESKIASSVKSETFREEEIMVGNGDWQVPGTLTVPAGKGPFPAVVLVHGSGPHDRDETIVQSKPFRDLAWGLASKGIGVVRYEKRTKTHASKIAKINPAYTVKEEVIDDAVAAIQLLRERKEFNPKKIYILGHSLGGMVAPHIAEVSGNIAGLISLAGNTRPIEDLIEEQTPYELACFPEIPEAIRKQQIELMERQIARLRAADFSSDVPASQLPLGWTAAYWISLSKIQPTETAKRLKVRMLFLQGERDYQVTLKDFEGWKKALHGHSNATFRSYPNLNHLFMAGDGKSKPQEYLKAGQVDEQVIRDIAQWILVQ